jgi:hypothetical protein
MSQEPKGKQECEAIYRLHLPLLACSIHIEVIHIGGRLSIKDESNKMNGRDITFPDGRKLFVGSAGQGSPPDKSDK